MSRSVVWARRAFLAVGLAAAAGWLPVPVPVNVVNKTHDPIDVRAETTRPWVTIPPNASDTVITFSYDGLCSPPDRWLPDDFTGLQVRLADGSLIDIPRDTFTAEAKYRPGWTYYFRNEDSFP